jgi:hypothetical protein
VRNILCAWVLLSAACLAQAQLAKPSTNPSQDQDTNSVKKESLPLSASVITIRGLCPDVATAFITSISRNPCQSEISREAFEKVSAALQADSPAAKRQLAETLTRLLVMAHQGNQWEVDKKEHFQEKLEFSRMQLLSEEVMRAIHEKAAEVPEKDIEDYYQQHQSAFERATFERILVPTAKQAAARDRATNSESKPDAGKHAQVSEAALAEEAVRLQRRATSGEDFTKLQQAAYDAASVNAPIPEVRLDGMRRAGLPTAHLAVFNLQPGEVSSVISDSTGHYIYKLISKDIIPLKDATPEIQTVLQKQRANDILKQLQSSASAELNPSYF